MVCKQGGTREGTAAVTLERDGTILVCKKVSADVCEVFGEEYVDEHFDERGRSLLLQGHVGALDASDAGGGASPGVRGLLVGVVGAAHQRPALDVLEA